MVEPLATREVALTDLELNLLLEAIVRFSGHDYRDYAQGTLKRRIAERVRAEGVSSISGLQERVLHDPQALANFVLSMSGGSGHLFRDPAFFRHFRLRVVPLLRTYPFARIWAPNCACGEDAYALAMLLHEEGLLAHAMIYATDASELAIAAAKEGAFAIEAPEEPKAAHRAMGGAAPLAAVCRIDDRSLSFADDLKKHIIFAQHNLVTDASLNEFHVIVARGILPQFNKALQFRVHNLFLNSLSRLGFLCLGSNETLHLTPHERVFRQLSDEAPIYRRMR